MEENPYQSPQMNEVVRVSRRKRRGASPLGRVFESILIYGMIYFVGSLGVGLLVWLILTAWKR